MNWEQQLESLGQLRHLELLAGQIVEGFISGMHKSPFHGFSAEFAEHKIYNPGDGIKHIDWKLYAKTDRLYTKRFEEETNLRCHLIIDSSASMYYPELNDKQPFYHSKIGFAVLASAVLMNLLKKQRDAVGLSVYSDQYDYYAPEKGSDRHHRMLLAQLESLLKKPATTKKTDTVAYLHQIAEKLHRRSMVILFTDLFQPGQEDQVLAALQHLKHNKHKVVVFHLYDPVTELNFDFGSNPYKFIDVESGDFVQIHADQVQKEYQKEVKSYFERMAMGCAQHRIKYVPAETGDNFQKILTTYLIEKQNFG